jgi:hypothetical protein
MADTPNPFAGLPPSSTRPAVYAASVTPNDSTDLALYAKFLWVGGAGSVKVDMIETGTVTFTGVRAGTLLPIGVKRIWSTGTTATNILALR